MRMCEVKLTPNKISMQQNNPVDIKPKSTNLIEPGLAFEQTPKDEVFNHAVSFHIKEGSKEKEVKDDKDTFQMIEQLANRNFVVRRGRNNRILANAIVRNIFQDNFQDSDKSSDKQVNKTNRGQNHYL